MQTGVQCFTFDHSFASIYSIQVHFYGSAIKVLSGQLLFPGYQLHDLHLSPLLLFPTSQYKSQEILLLLQQGCKVGELSIHNSFQNFQISIYKVKISFLRFKRKKKKNHCVRCNRKITFQDRVYHQGTLRPWQLQWLLTMA